MIDTFFILFTGGMAVYVILRATILDQAEAWYEVAPQERISSPAQRRTFSDRTLDKSAGLGAARRGR